MLNMNKPEDDLNVNFVANAGVKDIVGRGLIYNDNVAIIELVKNSKDADSPTVEISFCNVETDAATLKPLFNKANPEIIIQDCGKGMTRKDIKNKWLNIAYSEKKNNKAKNYAGNKGVGRFSCDRLGEVLFLYTKSKDDGFLKLKIDWTLFENRGEKDEISSIPLKVEILSRDTFETETKTVNFDTGTILRIGRLRSDWSEQKLKKLITELEKFSPSLDHGFEIYLNSNTEYKDQVLKNKVNKKINNGILEKLAFKTIYIKSSISRAGDKISTQLYYQGEEIYRYAAKNPYKTLSNISVEIHYLDSISKGFFTRNIGVNPNDYGSIFLFYNGFRVSPYGNEKNDWLNLDQRKAQGTSRNLGTRDLFGRIDIVDNKGEFSVITSREGLAHNKAFFDLAASDPNERTILKNGKLEYGFVSAMVRQLEKFVVDGLDWNRLIDTWGKKKSVSASDVEKNPDRFVLKELSKERISQTIDKVVTSSFEVDEFEINTSLISNIKNINQKKIDAYLAQFEELVGDRNFAELQAKDKTAVKKVIKELKYERDIAKKELIEAEDIVEKETKKRIITAEKLKLEEERSSFLERLVDPEKTLDALITHVVQQISGGIEKDARSILSAYYDSPESVSKEELVEVLEHAVIDISIIKETANMATKANFDLKVSSVKQDLFKFMQGYIEQVVSNNSKWGINIVFKNIENSKLIKSFNPAEVCVLFVNLIENARKANTTNFIIECSNNAISFIDDGDGFDFDLMPADNYIKKGITTTVQGSGLGLNHCYQIAKSLNANFIIKNNADKGAKISLEFKT